MLMNDLRRTIYIVEDDPVTARVLSRYLESAEYRTEIYSDGASCLKAFHEYPVSLVIVDLHLPDQHGAGLITELNSAEEPPAILVHTADASSEQIIDTMKLGVFDYFIKPVDESLLLFKVERALEHKELERVRQALSAEREIQVQKKTGFKLWQETVVYRNSDRFDASLFENLTRVLSQGKGVGGLVTTVAALDALSEEKEGNRIMSAELFDQILKHADSVHSALGRFREIHGVLDSEPNLKRVSVRELRKRMEKQILQEQPSLRHRNQKLVIDTFQAPATGVDLYVDADMLLPCIKELFINAMKYSGEGSEIYMISRLERETLRTSILSSPDESWLPDGLSEGMDRRILEPFTRLHNHVDERYETLDYGLGLTYVDKVLRKHGGRLSAYNLVDYSDLGNSERLLVNVEMILPMFRASRAASA